MAKPPALVVDARAQPRPSLVRLGLAPASLVVCAALFYLMHWPMAGVVAVALVVLLVSIWIGPLLDASRRTLDRDLVSLLSAGRPEALASRIDRATLFRWLGAPAEVAEREGRALRATGDRKGALAAYRRAVDGYGAGVAPLSAIAGLGHAAYEAGDDVLARRALEAALAASPGLPEVEPRLAHLRLLVGESPDLPPQETGETARLVAALSSARDGDLAPGKSALAEIPADESASWARARADLVRAIEGARSSTKRKKKR